MEELDIQHLIVYIIIAGLVPWSTWLSLRVSELKIDKASMLERIKGLERFRDDHSTEFNQLEEKISSKFREVYERIDNLPDKIINRIKEMKTN